MSDLVGNLWSALGSYLRSWVFPSTFGVGFFAFALLPRVDDLAPWSGFSDADSAQGALLYAFATLAVSFALSVIDRPFVRLLEGYTLRPRWLKERWIASQRQRRKRLRQQVVAASSLEDKARLREELNQFPRNASWVLPTRLGNALRAGETYGDTQYGLSTLILWTRLVAVVDEKVTRQLGQSKAVVDFFVAMMALSSSLAVATVIIAVQGGDAALLLWLLPLCGLMPFWYDRAVAAVRWYADTMQALADLRRQPLAQELGIRLPGDLVAEQEVWQAVSEYAAWGPNWGASAKWVACINEVLVERGATAAEPADHPPPGIEAGVRRPPAGCSGPT